MDIRIDGPFNAPMSPWQNSSYSARPSEVGHKLFDCASDFYAWYMSWDSSPTSHSQTFRILSQIMQISKASYEGGNYLCENEEHEALGALSHLREQLFDGNLRTHDILHRLTDILQSILNRNPKAKVIAHTIELEYVFCIRPAQELSPDAKEAFQQYLDTIVKAVNPSLLETHAHAIAQGMAKVLEDSSSITDPKEALEKAINRWIA